MPVYLGLGLRLRGATRRPLALAGLLARAPRDGQDIPKGLYFCNRMIPLDLRPYSGRVAFARLFRCYAKAGHLIDERVLESRSISCGITVQL
jgi:hypothetical protein